MKIVRPLIKQSHRIIIADDGDICIGEIQGKSKIITNPPEWVKTVLSKMSGMHTLPRIIKETIIEFPLVKAEEIENFINKLVEFNLVTDNSVYSSVLSAEELERYDRQILQYAMTDHEQKLQPYKYQERLKASKVLILGMGGWGSWCAQQLAMAGVGSLRIVDGDNVDLSNLNRQLLYTKENIGQEKVYAAAERLSLVNPNLTIEPYYEFANNDIQRLKELISGTNFIILAWANIGYYTKKATASYIHQIASDLGIPIIELGGDPNDISIGPIFLNDGSHPKYEEVKSTVRQKFYSKNLTVRKFQEARMKNQFLESNRVVNAWQSAPSLATMSGLACDQIIKTLTKYDKSYLVGKVFHMNLNNYETRIENVFETE